MTTLLRVGGVLTTLMGVFLVWMIAASRTSEGEPLGPNIIAGVAVLGTLVALWGIVVFLIAADT